MRIYLPIFYYWLSFVSKYLEKYIWIHKENKKKTNLPFSQMTRRYKNPVNRTKSHCILFIEQWWYYSGPEMIIRGVKYCWIDHKSIKTNDAESQFSKEIFRGCHLTYYNHLCSMYVRGDSKLFWITFEPN